jgi:hypothetical protein
MKTCTKCGEEKELSEFSKKASSKDGLRHTCKCCCNKLQDDYRLKNLDSIAKRGQAYRKANPEKIAKDGAKYRALNKEKAVEYAAKYYAANKEVFSEKSAVWRHLNFEKASAQQARWRRENPHMRAATGAKRKSTKLQATPAWSDIASIVKIYKSAVEATRFTGIKHHVDHIVPLQGGIVCGLHVSHNLMVLPGSDNSRKGNRYWPDMPVAHREQPLC